jgi:hypothetical protein
MRDIIWTIIIIWVVVRIINAFRSYSSPSAKNSAQDQRHNTDQSTSNHTPAKKGELKPGAGEYVDYEEIK